MPGFLGALQGQLALGQKKRRRNPPVDMPFDPDPGAPANGGWNTTPGWPGTPAAPPAPGVPSVGGGKGKKRHLADPRDSIYYGQLASSMATRDQGIAGIQRQGGYAAVDQQEAIRRMLEEKGKTLAGADVSANKRGLFNSGILGKQKGEIALQYQRQQSDSDNAFNRAEEERNAQIQGLQSGYTNDDQNLMAAAIQRQIRDDDRARRLELLSTIAHPKKKRRK